MKKKGKVVFQMAMHTKIKKAIGIELSKTRIDQSFEILRFLEKNGIHLPNVEFYADTMFNYNLWKHATIVFSWAYCFKHLLPDLVKNLHICTNLKYFILHDATLEELNLEPKDFGLKRIYEFHDPTFNGHVSRGLYIYKRITNLS